MIHFDVLIIGASASGLMCAIEAGKRGRKVVVLDHADKAGKKIRISGGGRCNFSNYDVNSYNYLSDNIHFCKSALSQYHYYDFLNLLADYQIPWHEREHGQLFCERSANDIVQMLLAECEKYAVAIHLHSKIHHIEKKTAEKQFTINTSTGYYCCESLVIASGGLSVSRMGASDFGLQTAKQFALNVIPTRPGLVPLSYSNKDLLRYKQLSGIAVQAELSYAGHYFRENLLFTHKGISGPVVLQISSYWQAQNRQPVMIKLLPEFDLYEWLLRQKHQQGKVLIKNLLAQKLPKRLAECICSIFNVTKITRQYSDHELKKIAEHFQQWPFWPAGTEGYRVAEVTIGGVDTGDLSSKTMQAKNINGLYFIGEVVDVSGHLGGYNFQWAWASGFTAGQYV